MKKLMLLVRVLFRCGKTSKAEKSGSAVGDTSTLITMAFGVAAIVGMFFAGSYAAQHMDKLGTVKSVFTTVLVAAGMVSFVFTLMNAVNQLYIASDLDVLITLPFSPMQIVAAKMVSISVYPAAICLGMVVPAAIGFSIKADNLSAMFIPSMIIGAILLTIYVASLVASLLMVVMRVFRFVRSRNMLSLISTIIIFAFSITVFMIRTGSDSKLDEEQAVGMFHMLDSLASGLGFVFPTVGFTMNAALGQISGLLLAVLVVAGMLAVLTLLSRTIYLSAALGMTDANGSRERLNASGMKKYTSKFTVRKTLARHELRQILRTPALITNGYLYSIVIPYLIIIPMLVKLADSLKTMSEGSGISSLIDGLRMLIDEMNIPPMMLVFGGSLFSLIVSALAVSLSCLSRYIISREGKNFALIKTMPISARELVTVKRNVALLFNGISGLVLPFAVFIVLAALQFVPVWVSVICMAVNFAWVLAFVDICASIDVSKPNLNWETETDITKNNMTGLIILLGSFAALIGLIFMMAELSSKIKSLDTIAGIMLCVIPIAGAVVCELRLRRHADRLF